MGEVPEEVLRGADAEPLELLGAALADALEELDGGVEAEGAGGRWVGASAGVTRAHRGTADGMPTSLGLGRLISR